MRLIDADQLKDPFFLLSVDLYGLDQVIDAVPTVDAEPVRHGRWIYREYREYNSITSSASISIGFYKCSVCGHGSGVNVDNYCPNCGAKMDEEEEDNGGI